MPMIDVYAASDLFPEGADRALAAELTAASSGPKAWPNRVPLI